MSLMKYVGLLLATANNPCNDEEVLTTCGYSRTPCVSSYVKYAQENDFHKGQLLIINTYLSKGEAKHGINLDRTDITQCNLRLNFFVYKAVV